MIWLIGSRAVQHHLKDKMYRSCSDTDLMCTPDNVEQLKFLFEKRGTEYTLTESNVYPGKFKLCIPGSRTFEIDATMNESRQFLTEDYRIPFESLDIEHIGTVFVPSLHMLYAIKRAHAGVPVHTDKTLHDLIKLGRILFGDQPGTLQLNGNETYLYEQLKAEAEARDAKRKARINFNKPAEDFFKQSEKFRQYTHDKVHDVTCRGDAPLFRENLKYVGRALIDMDLFMSRPLDYRLTMVREEAIVIGIERNYLENRNMPAQTVYRLGLTKLVRDLSKGRFQEFMLAHMHILAGNPDWDFLNGFNTAEQQGYFDEDS